MKIYLFKRNIYRLVTLLCINFFSTAILGQDNSKTVNEHITKVSKTWYTEPWLWILGGALLLLLLVTLLQGDGNRD